MSQLLDRFHAARPDLPHAPAQLAIDISDDAQTIIYEIEQQIERVKIHLDALIQLQKRIPSVTSESELTTLQHGLGQITEETDRLNGRISTQLSTMHEEFQHSPSPTETTMRRNVHGKLTRDFMAVLKQYYTAQQAGRKACRERSSRLHRQSPETEPDKQHKDMLELEKSIVQTNQLFMDMQMLTNQQGEKIVSIEDHVDRTVENVVAGTENLVDAHELAERARRKRWILVGLSCLILVVILVVVLVTVLPKKM
jgi:t-SNARE complex subunit (syntaxin)